MEKTDRIERQIVIRGPRSRVWQALTQASEFGAWFRVDLEGEFAVGERITGKVTYPGHEGAPFVAVVVRMDPEESFAFQWPAGSEDPEQATADEPMTLVEFRLEDAAEGTRVTVVESGFDQLPSTRRLDIFRGNSEGWTIQVENLRRHVES